MLHQLMLSRTARALKLVLHAQGTCTLRHETVLISSDENTAPLSNVPAPQRSEGGERGHASAMQVRAARQCQAAECC